MDDAFLQIPFDERRFQRWDRRSAFGRSHLRWLEIQLIAFDWMRAQPNGYWPFTGGLMALQDMLPSNNGKPDEVGSLDDQKFAKEFPCLHEFCSVAVLPDGKKRELPTLLFFVEGAEWKARLADRQTGYDLWTTAETFWKAVQSLEKRLSERPIPWRKSTPFKR